MKQMYHIKRIVGDSVSTHIAAEYALLKRVGLDNVMSGYFNFAK